MRSRCPRSSSSSIGGKLLILWDGLPAYAPELNPAEYIFGYANQPELANLCADTIDEVRRYTTRRLKSM